MEIEVKAKVEDLEDIKTKLIQLGASFDSKKKQVDQYFKEKGKEMEPQGPGSALLRIRKAEKENFITVKKLTGVDGAWIEHETKVEDAEEFRKIIESLNYSNVLTITKEREQGWLEEFELCLDNIEELGCYLEVAVDSEDVDGSKRNIQRLLSKLGFNESDVEHRGYARILFEEQGVRYNT